MPDDLMVFAHIGDLHLTTEDQDNYRDLEAIVSEIVALPEAFDFIYLPGDNADNGRPEQYALAARRIARLSLPVHIITGDHDMEPGSLGNFYQSLDAAPLPMVTQAGGVRCLFLDICGPGSGGPDFRIGASQAQWLESELRSAAESATRCAIFMHSYPVDLCGEGETAAINRAFDAREVLLVEMGHTHYNELANDGRTIFAATRSTGQIEEGPVGYSITTIDRRVVSWRFKELGGALPTVLITAPADRRLATDANEPDHLPRGEINVRVKVLHRRPIVRCVCRIDERPEMDMQACPDGRYDLTCALPSDATAITVEAEDDAGFRGSETLEIARSFHLGAPRHADGSDADAVGAWKERGIFGTQLGPNRNGKTW